MIEKKITLKEFWGSKEKLAIHCDTLEKANKLLCAFDRMGKKWLSGYSYTKAYKNFWEPNTCYTNERAMGSVERLKRENVKIYEFEEVDLNLKYSELELDKTYILRLPNGDTVRLNVSEDVNYPGFDIEIVRDCDKVVRSRPRMLFEIPYNEQTKTYDDARLLVWNDINSGNYTEEINFIKPSLPTLPTTITYDVVDIDDDEDPDAIIYDKLRSDFGYSTKRFDLKLEDLERKHASTGLPIYRVTVTNIIWDLDNDYNYWYECPEKITLRDFFHNPCGREMAIHLDTLEKNREFIRACNKMGKRWQLDYADTMYAKYKENTCFVNYGYDEFYYYDIDAFKGENRKIYEFEDVNLSYKYR